jgi:hypothetical protein
MLRRTCRQQKSSGAEQIISKRHIKTGWFCVHVCDQDTLWSWSYLLLASKNLNTKKWQPLGYQTLNPRTAWANNRGAHRNLTITLEQPRLMAQEFCSWFAPGCSRVTEWWPAWLRAARGKWPPPAAARGGGRRQQQQQPGHLPCPLLATTAPPWSSRGSSMATTPEQLPLLPARTVVGDGVRIPSSPRPLGSRPGGKKEGRWRCAGRRGEEAAAVPDLMRDWIRWPVRKDVRRRRGSVGGGGRLTGCASIRGYARCEPGRKCEACFGSLDPSVWTVQKNREQKD